MAAQRKVDATDIILEQSETTRKEVNAMVESQHQEFDRKVAENSKNLKEVTDQINGLGDKIIDINEMVRSFLTKHLHMTEVNWAIQNVIRIQKLS